MNNAISEELEVSLLEPAAEALGAVHEQGYVGYNNRTGNLLAALGRAQLSRLDRMIERRCGARVRPHGGPTLWKPMHARPILANSPRLESGVSEKLCEQGSPCRSAASIRMQPPSAWWTCSPTSSEVPDEG